MKVNNCGPAAEKYGNSSRMKASNLRVEQKQNIAAEGDIVGVSSPNTLAVGTRKLLHMREFGGTIPRLPA
jgi:hypothetical protein